MYGSPFKNATDIRLKFRNINGAECCNLEILDKCGISIKWYRDTLLQFRNINGAEIHGCNLEI
jgi:hypothetical protein